MLKKLSFLFFTYLFLFLGEKGFAQDYSVSGTFIDNKENPVEGVEIIIFVNQSIRGSAVTDSNGSFFTSIPKGIYGLKAIYFGEEIYTTNITVNENLNLSKIKIDLQNIQLDEVTINTKKKTIETKADRIVFNVENSVRASGNDALDLLKGTPGVRFQMGNLALVGKNSVRVMIDDRIIMMSGDELNNYLRSLSSDNIKSIEIITTPPAKYDAEGNSGLINIKLKKAAVDTWSAMYRSSYFQSTYASFSSLGSFKFNKKKFSFSADVGGRKGSFATYETSDVFFENENWLTPSKREDFINMLSTKITTEYKINNDQSIGGSFNHLSSTPDISDRSTISILNNSTNAILGYNQTNGFNSNKVETIVGNVFFIQKLDTLGKTFSVDFDIFTYDDRQSRVFDVQDFDSNFSPINNQQRALNTNNQLIKNYSGKFDIELPFSRYKINFGAKLSFIDTFNDVGLFDFNGTDFSLNQGNIFDYNEDTQAFYASYSKDFNEKWKTQIGLRFENTTAKGISRNNNETNVLRYNQFFPTLYVVYTANENHNFSINYNKRIQRPIFEKLNPFEWIFTPFLIYGGNPFLQPSFIDKIEFTYNYKYKLSTNVYASKQIQGERSLPFIDAETNITTVNYDNFYNLETFGITQTWIFDTFSWWESVNQINGFYNKTNFYKDVAINEFNGFGYSFSSNNNFNFDKKKRFSGDVTFTYNSQRNFILYNITQSNSLDFGLRYKFPETGITINFMATDVFRSNLPFYNTVVNNIARRNSIYFDERSFVLSFIYKFGSKKLTLEERQSGNSEEKERLQ